MTALCFLKLGGSLITDKNIDFFVRRDVLARLASEIANARQTDPLLKIVIGHGSGSFGHVPAKKFGTRAGVHHPQEWRGFVEVWKEARALNQHVIDALLTAGLPVVALPPSAAAISENGKVLEWNIRPVEHALAAGLLPLINGDVIFDTQIGGTILSTEDLFLHLANELHPDTILLAGKEEGVFEDYPACTHLISAITPDNYAQVSSLLGGSAGIDVTGGMAQKVAAMLSLIRQQPRLKAAIFSGQQPGLLQEALLGQLPGTVLHI